MKGVIHKIFILLIGLFTFSSLWGQDIHFSQHYFNPMFLNPAQTGYFPGDYRVSSSYKNQWQSITNPYRTYQASAELSLPVKRVGIGLAFFNDRAGKSQIGTSKGDLNIGYTLRVNSSNSIGAGFQFGFGQQSVNYADLRWDNQYNGVLYDPSLPTGEPSFSNSYTYMDVGAGLMWDYYNKYNKLRINMGAAAFHINQPTQSFYGSKGEGLPMKLVGTLNAQIQVIADHGYIIPITMFSQQGPYSEITVGGLFKYVIGVDNASDLVYVDRWTSSAVLLGAHYRVGDAIVANIAIELKKSILVGFSYDLNISKLRVASNLRGGMELALYYRGAFY